MAWNQMILQKETQWSILIKIRKIMLVCHAKPHDTISLKIIYEERIITFYFINQGFLIAWK